MKFLFALCIFFSTIAYAGMQSVVRDASVTNIENAYTHADAALFTNVKANNICCINYLGSTVRICTRANAASACGDDVYLEDGGSFCFEDHPLASSVFVKSESGSITTGIIWCRVWRN